GNDTPAGGNDTPAGGNDTTETPLEPIICDVHDFEAAETEDSTCTQDGEIKYVCKTCQSVQYEVIPACHKVENNKCTLCNLEAATNLEFSLSADGKSFEVTGIGSYDSSDVIVPSHVAGLPVVKVSGIRPVKKVYLPDTVTAIGDGAFKGTNLESIYIPDSVTEIGASAFEECTKLARIKLPESVKSIGSAAFKYCNMLTDIKVPHAVTVFSDEMFYNCNISMEALGELARVTYMGSRFWRPSQDIDVFEVPYGCELGEYAFQYWRAKEIILPDSLSGIPVGLFESSYITTVTIPKGVTEIGARAFAKCGWLEKVVMPDGITKIDIETFQGCTTLTEINLPDCVEIIDVRAFENCAKLDLASLPSALKEISIEAFKGVGIKNVVLPENMTLLGIYAFANSAVESVVFNGAEVYGGGIFSYCDKLTSLTIGESVEVIPESAFAYSNLFFVTVPGTVKEIEAGAFAYCKNLQQVLIEEGVERIRVEAFSHCTSLKSVKLPQSLRHLEDRTFRKC
ncbi:MAG: leucine-rich repeat domain-containing protein, partial [Clostridia bacterium]|nr:leucine-rich repeat domain-containing protein [Clostridia bacterium]